MESLYQKVKAFVESNPACKKGMSVLKSGTSIGVVLVPNYFCILRKDGKDFSFNKSESPEGDIVIYMQADAAKTLINLSQPSLAELGIEIIKEIFLGRIDVEIKSSVFELGKKGYFKLPLSAGAPFLAFLASHGMGQMSKVLQWIEEKRRKAG